jgi:UbiA prenyltransferase family protein/haloacid dehalogenase-like hydrolase
VPASAPIASPSPAVPLCVDLDGTLIHSDLLWESFAQNVRLRPWRVLLVPWWFLQGRARLKQRLAAGTVLDVARLPYNDLLLARLREEKARGRAVLLVTASDRDFAQKVGDHVGLFDEVLGSDGVTNLRAERKAATLAQRFGERGFDYAGNSSADPPVWARAHGAWVVNAPPALARQAHAHYRVLVELPGPANTGFPAWRELLRPSAWLINLLVLVPLGLTGQIAQPAARVAGGLAFVAFSLGASAIYFLEDVLNLESDRGDPVRRLRPLAAGRAPISLASLLGLLLGAAGLTVAAQVTPALGVVLAGYMGLASLYAWQLKYPSPSWLGLLVLAELYSLRVVAGYAAIDARSSLPVMAVSLLVFVGFARGRIFRDTL